MGNNSWSQKFVNYLWNMARTTPYNVMDVFSQDNLVMCYSSKRANLYVIM